MAIENFNEVKQYITENMDKNEDVKNYVNGFVTDEKVKAYLGTDNGKKLMQPTLDSYFSKGLETWKGNNLDKLVEEKYKQLHPDADPKDTEIAKLKQQFEQMQKDNARKELTNKALKIATEKKLPTSLIDFFIGQDEDSTAKNLETLEKAIQENVNKLAEERLKSGYKPPKGGDTGISADQAQINKIFGLK